MKSRKANGQDQHPDAPSVDSNIDTQPAFSDMNGPWTHGSEDASQVSVTITTMPSTTLNGGPQTPQRPLSPAPQAMADSTNSLSPLNPSKSTGKVIDRLTTANERLTRELNAEKAKTQSQTDDLRAKVRLIETLTGEKALLQAQVDLNNKRKNDWKEIEKVLNNHILAEQERRKKAEAQVTGLGIQLDTANSNAAKNIAEMKKDHSKELITVKNAHAQEVSLLRDELNEARQRASKVEEHNTYLEAQSRAYNDGYKRVVKEQTKVITELRRYGDRTNDRVDEAQSTIKALDVVAGQQRHEVERAQHMAKDMESLLVAYKEEVDKLKTQGGDLESKVTEQGALVDRIHADALNVLGTLRWALSLNLGDMKKPE